MYVDVLSLCEREIVFFLCIDVPSGGFFVGHEEWIFKVWMRLDFRGGLDVCADQVRMGNAGRSFCSDLELFFAGSWVRLGILGLQGWLLSASVAVCPVGLENWKFNSVCTGWLAHGSEMGQPHLCSQFMTLIEAKL